MELGAPHNAEYPGVRWVEKTAAVLALPWPEEIQPGNVWICSDWLSLLHGLRPFIRSPQNILLKVFQVHSTLIQQAPWIGFFFLSLPSHVGLRGKETADGLAKQALHGDAIDLQVPSRKSEVRLQVWSKAVEEGQGRCRFPYSFLQQGNSTVRNRGRTGEEKAICIRKR